MKISGLLAVSFLVSVLSMGRCVAGSPSQKSHSSSSVPTQDAFAYPFQNPALGVEDRITDLISRMTLDEKIDALGPDPSVPRLGVAATSHVEGLHGLALDGPGTFEGRGKIPVPATQFPQPRGLGQTWDPALLEQVAATEAYEVRYTDAKYHRGGLVVRAPNADLARDPRWGRGEELYGEDPFLVGTMATAYTKGLQGNDSHYWMTASLLKHFLANNNEEDRFASSSDFDERLFHEYYAEPFRMAIEDGQANALMAAYNEWNSVPMSANPALREVVMKQWGFDGIICTDLGALGNMVVRQHYAKSVAEAVTDALHAGVNQFLDNYKQGMRDALAQKLITEQELNASLRGVYRVMIRLGVLDPRGAVPYAHIGFDDVKELPAADRWLDPWNWPEHKALVRRATDESIVLLKNERNTLPLDAKQLKSIAVIGPYADVVLLDWYSGTPPYAVSALEGIRSRAGEGVSVTFSKGTDLTEAAQIAKAADVAIVVIGNNPTCNAGWNHCPLPSDGKEAVDRKSLTLEQEEIAKAVYAANPHTVVVLNASFPYTTAWAQQNIPAIVEMVHSSDEEGNALAGVLFGDYDPAGRLTQTWVASMDDLPPMMDYGIRNGRTYLYSKQKPLYPFGYGLSYTSFAYSNLKLSAKTLSGTPDAKVSISFEVRNTGHAAGDEVAQLYVAHAGSKVPRPLEELKGFARIDLKPGESRTLTLPLTARALAYWEDKAKKFVTEADTVEVRVGASSADIRLRDTLVVSK